MKKLLIAATILATTFTTAVSADFILGENNFVVGTSSTHSNVFMMVRKMSSGGYQASFHIMYSNANEMQCAKNQDTIIKVNGQRLKALIHKAGPLQCGYYPNSKAAADFLLSDLYSKESIEWGGVIFPTKGVNQAVRELMNTKGIL